MYRFEQEALCFAGDACFFCSRENMRYAFGRPFPLADLKERPDDQRRHPVEKIIGGKSDDKRICIIVRIFRSAK